MAFDNSSNVTIWSMTRLWMTDTSTSSNNACTYTRHLRSEISPFRQASRVPSSMQAGIGVLIVVTAAVRLSNASFNIPAL